MTSKCLSGLHTYRCICVDIISPLLQLLQ